MTNSGCAGSTGSDGYNLLMHMVRERSVACKTQLLEDQADPQRSEQELAALRRDSRLCDAIFKSSHIRTRLATLFAFSG